MVGNVQQRTLTFIFQLQNPKVPFSCLLNLKPFYMRLIHNMDVLTVCANQMNV